MVTIPAALDACGAELRAAVAHAYDVFARHAAPPFPLAVCLSCCVSSEIEQQLREWSLSRITDKHLYEYNASAKPPEQPAQEVGHLLPRMFDLLADDKEIHHSLELSLVRLGQCADGSWNAVEIAAIERFAKAYFESTLRGPLAHRWSGDPLTILLMFDIGGLPIDPLLQRWMNCEDPSSTIQYVKATYWDFWSEKRYTNAFSADRPAFQQGLAGWLQDPTCRRRFAARLVEPEFQALAAHQEDIGCVSFATMVDAVFEHLTA